MSIGDNIKLRRIKEGIKQQDLAELAGITASLLSQIEGGKKAPPPLTPQTGCAIAQVLQCSVYDLIKVECRIELAEADG